MSFFLIALFSSAIVIWVFQAVNYLDIMIEDGRSYSVYISYSILNFPKILNKLFPFVLFFSLYYVTIKYENNNELIIFWNFGIQKIKLVNFVFKFSLIFFRFNSCCFINTTYCSYTAYTFVKSNFYTFGFNVKLLFGIFNLQKFKKK